MTLSTEILKAQARRCPCGGSDDYCPCQNVPDRITRTQKLECPVCNGLGEWDEGPLPAHSTQISPVYRQVKCPTCGGRGWFRPDEYPVPEETADGELEWPELGAN